MRTLNSCRYSLAVLSLLLLGACTPIAVIPDKIGNSALVVAEFQSTIPGVRDYADPVIDGTRYQYGNRKGRLIMSLSPGTHTLDALIWGGQSGSVPVPAIGGNITQYSYSRYPLDLKFETKPGEVTYLGTLLLFAPTSASSRYAIAALDDADGFEEFLRLRHPELYDSLTNKRLALYQTDKTAAQNAEVWRPRIAARSRLDLFESLQSDGRKWKPNFVTGPIGTVALVQDESPGGRLTVVPTATLADLTHCRPSPGRFACAISTTEYLLVEGLSAEIRKPPESVKLNSVYAFGAVGLAVVDQAGDIYTSEDNGETWLKYVGMRDKPMPDGSVHDFAFHETEHGLYVYNVGDSLQIFVMTRKPRLFYADYRDMRFRQIEFPDDAKWINDVHELRQGLYLGPANTGPISNDALFVKRQDDQGWERRALPSAGCGKLMLEDEDSPDTALRIACYGGQFRSADGGMSWSLVRR